MEQKRYKYKEVLVARFSALGDVAMSIPVLYSVCRSYEGIHFTFVTREAYTALFINKPANLTVIGVDVDVKYKGIGGLRRLSADLGKPDVFVDLHSVLRTHVLSLFMRLKGVHVYKIDKGRKYKRKLVHFGAGVMSPLKTTAQRYSEAFLNASLRITSNFDGLFAQQPADAQLFATVSAPKAAGEQWIGIAPFAAHQGKIYPLDRMRQVLDALAERANTKIFLFGGGEAETKTLSEWAAAHTNVVCVAGKKLGFVAELALMSQLDVMLSMDSGNMHLAAIAGAHTVSIWGPTHPSAGFVAWHTQSNDCLGAGLECRPCSIFGNKPCRFGDMRCMLSVKPKDVIAHINKILA